MILGRIAKLAYKMTPKRKAALAKAVKASALARKNATKSLGSKVAYNKSHAKALRAINKRHSKRLSKLTKRISDNNSALKSIKKTTKTVYRLENAKGQGPLMGNNLRHYAAMPRGTKMGYKVSPVSDYNRGRAAMLKKLAPKGTPFEEIAFKRGDKFGFDSKSQSLKYFSKEEQAFLKTRGFNLVEKKNVNVVGRTSTQVSFNTPKGLVSAQKEAAALRKKYEKLMKKGAK
jgi:hypothetical protein